MIRQGRTDMVPIRDAAYLIDLIHSLRRLPRETEWVEFKVNQATDPKEIGEYVSALANGATLNGKDAAYILWGIKNDDHEVVGTRFEPSTTKVGNEPLEHWLRRGLAPRIDFRFHEVHFDGKRVAILEIEPTIRQPVAILGERFIRVGDVKTNLREYPEKERALWDALRRFSFENEIAFERASDDDILSALDCPAYFERLGVPLPDGRAAILERLQNNQLILPCDAGGWNITNLAAVLLAKNMNDFSRIGRKTLRIVQYRSDRRTETQREQEFTAGYAVEFDAMVDYIMTVTPANEVIEQALRRELPMFPRIAVRELVANALIHQDLSITGAGPMVSVFDTRIEIANPGEPLVPTERFVDAEPKSRNESLARLMRRFNICEERGSGVDKVLQEVEIFQLPPPLFEAPPGSTRVSLFAHKPLSDMDKSERIRACYLHACLCYVTNPPVNNASIRERFGLSDDHNDRASRLLKEAVDDGAIRVRDTSVGTRSRTYLPFWTA